MNINIRPSRGGFMVRIRAGVPGLWFASRADVALYLAKTSVWECAQP